MSPDVLKDLVDFVFCFFFKSTFGAICKITYCSCDGALCGFFFLCEQCKHRRF